MWVTWHKGDRFPFPDQNPVVIVPDDRRGCEHKKTDLSPLQRLQEAEGGNTVALQQLEIPTLREANQALIEMYNGLFRSSLEAEWRVGGWR
jgi:hypothetical protein